LLSKPVVMVTAAAALLAACGDASKQLAHGTTPGASSTPSQQHKSADQILAVMPGGNEATIEGTGSRTVQVTVRTRSAFDFGCVGGGPLGLIYGPTERFSGSCFPDRISGLTTNIDVAHYPAHISISISVDPGTKWRLTLDSHPNEFDTP
jgi:hypothetical protein